MAFYISSAFWNSTCLCVLFLYSYTSKQFLHHPPYLAGRRQEFWGENLFTSGVCNSLIGLQSKMLLLWKYLMWDEEAILMTFYEFIIFAKTCTFTINCRMKLELFLNKSNSKFWHHYHSCIIKRDIVQLRLNHLQVNWG